MPVETLTATYLVQLILGVYIVAMALSLVNYVVGEVVTIFATILGFSASMAIAYIVLSRNIVEPILGGFLLLDPLGAWGLIAVSIFGLVSAIYSIGYMRSEVKMEFAVGLEKLRWYYLFFNATMLAMVLSVLSNNIILLWVAVEATTLATAFLVGFHETTTALEAAWKYVVICGVGVGFALFGTALIYAIAVASGIPADQAMLWTGLIANHGSLAKSGLMFPLELGLLLVVFGYMVKAGLFPVHVWLPDAHSEAPSPISAILSGVIVKCALIAILRFYALANVLGLHELMANVLLVVGILSMLVGGMCIYVQRDIKRLFAYSTIDQVGLIATATGLGTGLGILAALMHIIYHALAKALAFLGSGLMLIHTKGKRDFEEVGGLLRARLKFTAAVVTLALLGLIAMPPAPSFFSKVYLFLAAADKSLPVLIAVFVSMIVAELALIQRSIVMVFGGIRGRRHEHGHGEEEEEKETVKAYEEKDLLSCKLACLLLAIIVAALFLLVQPYINLAGIVAKEVAFPLSYLAR
ncbi:MAG TPA: hydrogenase 4 subunit F [Pyrodictium sp.]|nr:hydrogenase 4 subunit F [Pyrodictium sp.]